MIVDRLQGVTLDPCGNVSMVSHFTIKLISDLCYVQQNFHGGIIFLIPSKFSNDSRVIINGSYNNLLLIKLGSCRSYMHGIPSCFVSETFTKE